MSHTAERLYTVEELPEFPECYELVDGELIMMMSPAGWLHGHLVMKIGMVLGAYVDENNLGMTFGEQTGFILSNRASAMKRKLAQYFAAGTRLIWVVAPEMRIITVHAPGREPVTLHETDTLDGEGVIPGFHYQIAQLFARM